MDRQPVVAGRFYDADPAGLYGLIDGFMHGLTRRSARTILAMVPHAGYVYSGAVCGRTLGQANLASTVILLGPNHTGMGERFSLWPEGAWHIPGASVPVDAELALALVEADFRIRPDTVAHVGEHSLEVVLPFLHRLNPAISIVPVSISSRVFDDVAGVGRAVGRVLKALDRPVSIVVSSDMSHYISHDEAKHRDSLAIEAAVTLDPRALFDVVRIHGISMCGVLPMTAGLSAALEMGASRGELVAYATSGEVSGDFEQVVGYAGLLVE
jgi:AmmeMemoRadiSam system protein B